MERYRIEWQDGPRVVGGDTWVVDLDLLRSTGGSPFRFAKKLQVVATTDDVDGISSGRPDWTFWRALVAAAVGTIVRRVNDDELQLERPRTPIQISPDVAEARARVDEMVDQPIEVAELVSEFASA